MMRIGLLAFTCAVFFGGFANGADNICFLPELPFAVVATKPANTFGGTLSPHNYSIAMSQRDKDGKTWLAAGKCLVSNAFLHARFDSVSEANAAVPSVLAAFSAGEQWIAEATKAMRSHDGQAGMVVDLPYCFCEEKG